MAYAHGQFQCWTSTRTLASLKPLDQRLYVFILFMLVIDVFTMYRDNGSFGMVYQNRIAAHGYDIMICCTIIDQLFLLSDFLKIEKNITLELKKKDTEGNIIFLLNKLRNNNYTINVYFAGMILFYYHLWLFFFFNYTSLIDGCNENYSEDFDLKQALKKEQDLAYKTLIDLELANGIDYGFTGEVTKIDVSRIRKRLDSDSIVVINNMGVYIKIL
ncbi:hypothetical protein ACJX0J_033478 [Zea mays]